MRVVIGQNIFRSLAIPSDIKKLQETKIYFFANFNRFILVLKIRDNFKISVSSSYSDNFLSFVITLIYSSIIILK
jgi:hypothetical protein